MVIDRKERYGFLEEEKILIKRATLVWTSFQIWKPGHFWGLLVSNHSFIISCQHRNTCYFSFPLQVPIEYSLNLFSDYAVYPSLNLLSSFVVGSMHWKSNLCIEQLSFLEYIYLGGFCMACGLFWIHWEKLWTMIGKKKSHRM